MGTIKVREALRRASVLLLDIDDTTQFTRYEERWMVDALNDGISAIYTYLPTSCTRIDAVKLKPGSLQSIESIAAADCIPGDGSTPSAPIVGTLLNGILCNMGAAGNTPGRSIRRVSGGAEALDAINPEWRTASATQVRDYIYDPKMPRHFEVNPPVHPTTPVWVRMSLVAQPTPIPNTGTPGSELYRAYGTSTATMPILDEHVADLVYYVCARMLMMNAKFTGANGMTAPQFASLFTASINAKATVLLGTNPNLQSLPFAPEPIGRAS